jgi:hypothetical protein
MTRFIERCAEALWLLTQSVIHTIELRETSLATDGKRVHITGFHMRDTLPKLILVHVTSVQIIIVRVHISALMWSFVYYEYIRGRLLIKLQNTFTTVNVERIYILCWSSLYLLSLNRVHFYVTFCTSVKFSPKFLYPFFLCVHLPCFVPIRAVLTWAKGQVVTQSFQSTVYVSLQSIKSVYLKSNPYSLLIVRYLLL